MSSKNKKCIATYVDRWGNTSYGEIICLCEIIKKEGSYLRSFKVIEPKCFKERWSNPHYGLEILPDDISEEYKVGYYTRASHFKIMKKAGFIKPLDEDTKDYLNNITKERNNNCYTWYSKGLKLRPEICETQTELY